MKKRTLGTTLHLALLLLGASLLSSAARAQTPPAPTPAAAPARVVGPVVSVDGAKITIKDAQGTLTVVTTNDATRLVRITPGQTSLSSATPIQLSDIQPGDRLLVRVQPGNGGLVAVSVIAMKQADIAQQHAQAQAAWQHGVGGLVKSVDEAARTIVVTGAGAPVTIKLAPTALVKRYAAGSIEYDQAQPSSLDKIAPGDQLRARGTLNPADHIFLADEVVAGSFRNLSGKLTAVDAATGTVGFVDLATKQPVTVAVSGTTQLRRLDDATAEKLAEGMKSAGVPAGTGRPAGATASAGGNAGPAAHGVSEYGMTRGAGAGPGAVLGAGLGAAPGGPGSDLQQALAHAPAIPLAALKKGDFVMVVASSGADNQLGAVTLIGNVEPLLRASPNGSAAMLSSWSMGGGVPGQQ